jgi:hypothetical protein
MCSALLRPEPPVPYPPKPVFRQASLPSALATIGLCDVFRNEAAGLTVAADRRCG